MNYKAVDQPQDAFVFAQQLHRKGKLDKAEKCYRKLLKHMPKHIDALHYLGLLRHHQGKSNDALKFMRRALELEPTYVEAHNNLGNVLKELARFKQAELSYRSVISLRPDFAEAHNNLGVTLKSQKHFEEAIEAYLVAIKLNPHYSDAWSNLGNAYVNVNRLEDAITAYRQVIVLSPEKSTAYEHIGLVLYKTGRVQDAIEIYHEWLRQDPGNPIAEHMLAASSGSSTLNRASDAYVQNAFDDFADDFDESLERLGYQAPLLLSSAVQDLFQPGQASLAILDAGCGTGLCAEYFKPYAARLIGVDLSSGMIGHAKKLALYDELIVAELTQYLLAQQAEFELIVSADTLCYFGKLEEVLSAAHSALVDNGYLIFTLEQSLDSAGKGYKINPHGRYSHDESYVRNTLERLGFTIIKLEHESIRKELGTEVSGFIVVAKTG
jgi:predicted TPR repeat methyltransferase